MAGLRDNAFRLASTLPALLCGWLLLAAPPIARSQQDIPAPAEAAPAEAAPAEAAPTEAAPTEAAAADAGPGDAETADSAVDRAGDDDAAIVQSASEDASTSPDEAAGPVTRFELSLELAQLKEAEDFAAAAQLSDEYLALSEEEFGSDSPKLLADAYMDVAEVRSLNGDYEQAEVETLKAIDLYLDADGPFAETLIQPYLLLGDNYKRSGDHPGALSAYNEARNVNRRVFGLLNTGQLDIIERMSESAESLNQLDEAQSLQREAMTLVERRHEPYEPEMLEAIYRYALWLRGKGRFTAEREQYQRADRIIRDYYGPESIEMVRPLRERANSFRMQGAEQGIGVNGLRDAQSILMAQSDPDPLMLAEVLRDLGDWDVAFSRIGSDGAAYRDAWRLLGEVDNGDQLRDQWFEMTHIVYNAPLNARGLTADPTAPMGHVVVHFTVDESGRTSDVEIVESEPPGLKDEAVLRQVRQSRFRPLIREGELIPRRRAYNMQFRYIPDDDD